MHKTTVNSDEFQPFHNPILKAQIANTMEITAFLPPILANAGPISQANLYKSKPRSAFQSMSLWTKHAVEKVEQP